MQNKHQEIQYRWMSKYLFASWYATINFIEDSPIQHFEQDHSCSGIKRLDNMTRTYPRHKSAQEKLMSKVRDRIKKLKKLQTTLNFNEIFLPGSLSTIRCMGIPAHLLNCGPICLLFRVCTAFCLLAHIVPHWCRDWIGHTHSSITRKFLQNLPQFTRIQHTKMKEKPQAAQ